MKCVYKISCVDSNIKEFYIGSTDDLEKRVESHTNSCNNKTSNSNYKVYKFIRENGGISNWEINPIEIYECEMTKLQLKIEEQFYMDEYKPELNCRRAILTKEQKKEYSKEWQIENKEHILEIAKIWNEKNPQKIKLKEKKYREKNKEQINAKQNEKIPCPYCNKIMCRQSITRHIKLKHPTSTQ